MAMEMGHVHIKTYEPTKTAQSYIDNFGAMMKNAASNGSIQLNLHGLPLNVTTISSAQNRKQMMGIEHIALQTDNYASDIARLRSNARTSCWSRSATVATSLSSKPPTVPRWR
jgi:4-hydroxyphenylpyruvate dioxygenase-like putative hemolysin